MALRTPSRHVGPAVAARGTRASCCAERKRRGDARVELAHDGPTQASLASRRDVLLATSVTLAAAAVPDAALAAIPKGFSAVKNTNKGYAFLYPFGWQEVNVDGTEVAYKDIIEPLESISLEIIPTNKETIDDFGPVAEVAETLVKQVLVPPNQEGKVMGQSEKVEDGKKYYTIEYTAKAKNFTRHSITSLAVFKGKLYTVTTGANEKRWKVMKDRLKIVADSFTLL